MAEKSKALFHSVCEEPSGFFLDLCSKEFFFAFHIFLCAAKRINNVKKMMNIF